VSKLYRVNVREVHIHHIQPYEINADSPEEAIRLVSDGKGDLLKDHFEYSHILNSDLWDVDGPYVKCSICGKKTLEDNAHIVEDQTIGQCCWKK